MLAFVYGVLAQLPPYRPLIPEKIVTKAPKNGRGGALIIHDASSALAWVVLLGALIAILVSATMWSIGSKTGNQDQVFNAKRGAIAGVLAAFLVGAAVPLMNFFIENSSKIRF